MPKYSVKKPFTILVAVILVLVLGFVSLTGIQTDLLPAMNLPYLMVITTYPGASPEQVEADVTKPLENALSTLNGVKNVTSQSNENYSLLFLEYQDDTDMDSAMVKASTAVNQLGDALPDMASTPTLMEISPDMMATQYIAVDYDGMDIYELSDYVSENVLPQLERVDGVNDDLAQDQIDSRADTAADADATAPATTASANLRGAWNFENTAAGDREAANNGGSSSATAQLIGDDISIIADPAGATIPTELDRLWVLVSFLVAGAQNDGILKIVPTLLPRLPVEFSIVLLRDLIRCRPQIVQEKGVSDFLKTNKVMLF